MVVPQLPKATAARSSAVVRTTRTTTNHRRSGAITVANDVGSTAASSHHGWSHHSIVQSKRRPSPASSSRIRIRRRVASLTLLLGSVLLVVVVLVLGNVLTQQHWWLLMDQQHDYYYGSAPGEKRRKGPKPTTPRHPKGVLQQLENINPVGTVPSEDGSSATGKKDSAAIVESSFSKSNIDNDDDDDNPDIVPSHYYHSTSNNNNNNNNACAHTDGIYHISMGDVEGGVGTALVQLVVVQILYAQQVLNMTPWVHFQLNISHVIEDPVIHNNNNNPIQFPARVVVGNHDNNNNNNNNSRNDIVERIQGPHRRDVTPGRLLTTTTASTVGKLLQFTGTGIWGHYFEPVSTFVPDGQDTSCRDKLYVTLSLDNIDLIIPGLHGYWHHAVRCWRYDYLPEYVTQPHQSYHTWMAPQRFRAAQVVQQHIHYRPYLHQRATAALGGSACLLEQQQPQACLGLHIRHADKAAGRRRVEVSEFLPYASAFVQQFSNNTNNNNNLVTIYLATDSALVWHEIQTTWPASIVQHIQTSSSMVRSTNTTAVFDMGVSHHRTNQEVLVEILALSRCHALIHGHSAVSEAAIWTTPNAQLHWAAVNLEDDDHLTPDRFERLVQQIHNNEPQETWPQPKRPEDFWPPPDQTQSQQRPSPTHHACDGSNGVLLIASVGRRAMTATAFFIAVVNQLLFAEEHNLVPWVHLRQEGAPLLFDEMVHGNSTTTTTTFSMQYGMGVSVDRHAELNHSFYPTRPALRDPELRPHEYTVASGNGIWETYLEPVSEFVPGDESCRHKPLIVLPEVLVSPGLQSFHPWSIKAWRYDNIPLSVMSHTRNETGAMISVRSMEAWLEPMRARAHEIVQKYFRFRPFLTTRAEEVNPVVNDEPCLGVHIRLADKTGNFRRTVRAGEYLEYLEAFERAGGQVVYVALDTQRPLQYIRKNFPERLLRIIRIQGDFLVRSVSGEWPTHLLDRHHRVNSETLVDILALSKCRLLLHSYSTVAEAAIYLNPSLRGSHSVNLEDSNRPSPEQFEILARRVVGNNETLPQAPREDPTPEKKDETTSFITPRIEYNEQVGRHCRSNAVIYLAQKVHSSYQGRDSYSNILRSLELLNKNYLSINNHINNTDVFIFHTGDFNRTELSVFESRLGPPSVSAGVVRIVDLSGSEFWARPHANANDKPESWYAYPLFSEGYRRMMHWYAIDVWNFFQQWNEQAGCGYRYIFRLDEDSYIHSAIDYDIFEHMRSHQYVYGFRMCAYEMKVTQRMSTMWMNRHASFVPQRAIDLDMCGFYNNFFIADLDFFRSPKVSDFLRFIDSQGHIYRRRLGDLMIHSMAVYWFAPPEQMHRFLDFTYEHGTYNETNGCLLWGGMQGGFNDANAAATLDQFYRHQTVGLGCHDINTASLSDSDLSPTYAHVPDQWKGRLSIATVTAGNVELPPGKGMLSG